MENINEGGRINKQEQIKTVLQTLVDKKKTNRYSKQDIEKAILVTRGFDSRTVSAWFNALWRLEYFFQPEPDVYVLNFVKVAELEIKLPIEIDPNQDKLGRYL